MANNYILVDYQNVQPDRLPPIEHEDVHLWIFLGPNQPRIPVELAMKMQPMGHRARYICIATNGKNALDFVIAFSMGELANTDPSAFLHVISNDTGFDPLIDYLRSRKIKAYRHPSIDAVSVVGPGKDPILRERVNSTLSHFQKSGVTRPRTQRTLINALHAIFKKALSAEEISSLVQELQRRRYITIDHEKVEHHWPGVANGQPASKV